MECLLRTSLVAAIVAAAGIGSAAAADGGALRFDHYNPLLLNEHAVRKARDGDIGTALILLERAVQIAPYDARIRSNLESLRAWQAGKPMPDATLAVTPAATPAIAAAAGAEQADGAEDALPPFPLWKNGTAP
jgi:hypothetical protein